MHNALTANTSDIWQLTVHTTYRYFLAAQQELYTTQQLTLSLKQQKLNNVLDRSQENGSLAEKLWDRKSKRTRQKNKRGVRKGESNDSPEIPDRVGKSEVPGLPSGCKEGER